MLLAIHLGTIGLFVLLGIVFSCGKGANLIAGYNTMPQWEKARYDTAKLCRFMGRFLFVLAGCWLVVAAGELFHTTVLYRVGLGLFLAVTIAGVIYANTGNRFQK